MHLCQYGYFGTVLSSVQVRLQLLGEGTKGTKAASPLSVARGIVAEGGALSLYNGISAAYLRQATYATLRLGFFDRFLAFFTERAKASERSVGFGERATASLGAGGLAAAIANPSEVALIRMQADGAKPKAERANYKSVVDALIRVGRNEGVATLWAGSYPTIVRVRIASSHLELLLTLLASRRWRQISDSWRSLASRKISCPSGHH